METRTSKWVWSSILYRWPTLWCSWAPIFSVSSLCLGRKNTFSIFVLLKFINLVAHICLKLILLWMFHVTFSQLSPVSRFPTSVTCLEVRMRTSTVFSFWTFFTSFLQYYSRAASGKVVRSKWSVPVRMACVLSLGLSHHRAGNRWQQISFSYYCNKGRHSVRNNQPHPNAHLKGKREVGLSVFNWFSILKVVIWNSLFY